ncbi:glycosyltransferase, partial [Candidatus Uhrbacteria bacterium]|nr:glycosyltransferase [Candidatus Uhrbacteria bacterium]
GTAAFIANALGGPEYTVIFHGTDLKRVKNRRKRWLLRLICRNAKALIVNSEATKKILTRLIPSANPLVLTPGLEPFKLPDRAASREQLNILPDTKVILAVSRLVERKGIDTLIQAIANIEHQTTNNASEKSKFVVRGSEFELVIVGDGEYAEPLHKLAELTRVKIRWVPNATDDELYAWYASADIFCLPGRETSDDVEGFGMVFLEAAYAGLPVIAGDSGGASEAVVNNQTGLLIPPTVDACAEAIAKLINDPDTANRLGKTGRNRVITDFNWETRWESLSSNVKCPTSNVTDKPPTFDIRRSTLDVSVVIPCYNHAKELKATLESIAKQTVGVKEVIVIDDGSSDNPSKVAEQFKERLPLTFTRFVPNSGAPAARNRGAEIASGELIIFLDADAVLKPHALELMREALATHPQASYAYGDFIWGKRLFRGKPFNAKDLRRRNFIHTSALIRKNVFPGFDEKILKFQDWDLWLTMLKSDNIGVWIPEVLFSVTERKSGMSQWLPSFMYKVPWPILGYTPKLITKYRQAEQIIKQKHQLN